MILQRTRRRPPNRLAGADDLRSKNPGTRAYHGMRFDPGFISYPDLTAYDGVISDYNPAR